MRRRWCLLLSLALLAALALPLRAAAKEAVVSGQSCSAVPGAEFAYQVSISDNPGLSSYMIVLQYDEDVLSPIFLENAEEGVKCERGSVCQSGTLTGNARMGEIWLLWFDTREAASDGVLFTVWFRVNEGAMPGDCPIRLAYRPGNTTALDGSLVPLRCKNGNVTIRAYEPLLFCEKVSAKPGEEFDCVISLQDNPGVAAVKAALVFDQRVLELVKDADGKPVCEKQPGVPGNVAAKAYPNAVGLVWWNESDITQDGPVLAVRLRVRPEAEPGTAELKLVQTDILNMAEQPVALGTKNGALEIRSSLEAAVRVEDNAASVRITGAKGERAVIAFYDADGRMRLVRILPLSSGAASAEIRDTREALSSLHWKIMLLDAQNCPAGPAVCGE